MPRGKKRRARELSSSPSVFSSPDDDDEQATADLTLHILAKAEKRGQEDRDGTTSDGVAAEAVDSDDAGAAAEEEEEEEAVLSAKAKKKKKRKEKEKKEKELKVKKEERKEKRKNKAIAKVANLEDAKAEVDKSAEKDLPDAEESLAMRKLLRGPRYFDPPEEQGETCYSCGQQGHRAADCTEQPRQKPCYVCGNFGHEGYDCPEKTECFECGKIGHLARNCPSKVYQPYQARRGTGLCLLCGRLGHDASGCSGEYDPDDFKQVHCYICKRAGHLCCSEVVDSSPFPVSCYQCGDLGHTGLACTRQNEDRGERSSCYRCGQEGHFARECQQTNRDYNIKQRRHSWPAPWSADNGRFGDQEPPACQIRPVPFKKRLEQAQTPPAKKKKKSSDEGKKKKGNGEGKKKKNDEGKKGTKRKRNDSDFL